MINSISSMSSAMMMRSNNTQQHSPPPGENAFGVADSDGNGLVSGTELEAVVTGISETTGTTLNAEETLSTYDANQDGGLSGEELLALLTDNGFSPPQGIGSEAGGPPPPPPPSTEQALAAYTQNSDSEVDLISQLIDILQSSESDSESSSFLDITT